MASAKKKPAARAAAKLKDLKSKRNPKGGVSSVQWGVGRGVADSSSPKLW